MDVTLVWQFPDSKAYGINFFVPIRQTKCLSFSSTYCRAFSHHMKLVFGHVAAFAPINNTLFILFYAPELAPTFQQIFIPCRHFFNLKMCRPFSGGITLTPSLEPVFLTHTELYCMSTTSLLSTFLRFLFLPTCMAHVFSFPCNHLHS